MDDKLREVIRKLQEVAVELHKTTGTRFGVVLETTNRNVATAMAAGIWVGDFNPYADEVPLAPGVTIRVKP